MTVRRTIEALPPIYGIRAVRWPDGTDADGCYLGGWLTAERRDAAIVDRGWRVVE